MGKESAIFDLDAPTIEVSVAPSPWCGGSYYRVLFQRNSLDDDVVEDPVVVALHAPVQRKQSAM